MILSVRYVSFALIRLFYDGDIPRKNQAIELRNWSVNVGLYSDLSCFFQDLLSGYTNKEPAILNCCACRITQAIDIRNLIVALSNHIASSALDIIELSEP